ncbi:uncharacterized protein LOC134842382 isoform X2 [Symsagittifera roscoffensis]|uniref:uncharacterized protein LOC134842382 isoform X2 n=1 Tax=Symsagittifera roscoffensis TaxID=84072 RepID=UPI00307BD5BC
MTSKRVIRCNSGAITESTSSSSVSPPNATLSRKELPGREVKPKLTRELIKLEIQWPGGGKVKFSDHGSLKQFMESQYPDWKNPGKKTSIPCVRIPRIMIRNEQLSKKLQKHYKSLQKGEIGESKLYKLFVNEVSTEDSGLIILPNVDGSHIFEEGGPGSVEIDMIVAHPTKGIFVFSVKNEQKVNLQKLLLDMRKHTDFVRYLLCYNSRSEHPPGKNSSLETVDEVPIHAVFCYLPGFKSPIAKLAEDTSWYTHRHTNRHTDRVIVFQKSHFNDFASQWEKTILELPIMRKTEKFDTLVAFLATLNSMEGNSALIHHRFSSDGIQSIQVKTNEIEGWLEKQLDGTLAEEDISCKQDLVKATKTLYKEADRQKTTVILWTKEQLDIIGRVFKNLTNSSNEHKPLRLNVKGAKGSGKTMLMVFLAQLAERIYQKGETGSRVVICDGSGGRARILFSKLEKLLGGSDIEFWTELDLPEALANMGRGIIFIDEDPLINRSMQKLVKLCCDKHAHLVIFSSEEERLTIERHSYKLTEVALSHAMRSTKQMQTFSKNIVKNINTGDILNELNGSPSHNLDGTNPPEIVYVESAGGSETEQFFQKCVETVMRFAELSQFMSSILVVIDFLSPRSQMKIVSLLETRKVPMNSFSYKLKHGERNTHLQVIQLESTKVINGSEFGTVVILLEKMVNSSITEFRKSFHMAVTRATTNLAIVAADNDFFSSVLEEKELLYAVQNLRVRNFQVLSHLSKYITSFLEMCCQQTSIAVIIGNIPELDCLKKPELVEPRLNWSSTDGVKRYTFNGDKTVFVISNIAKACSKEALNWCQKQNISVFLVVIGNKMDMIAENLMRILFIKRQVILSNDSFISLTRSSESVVDISSFSKCLIQQTLTNCENPLSMPSPTETTIEAVQVLYTWKDLKGMIDAVEDLEDDDNEYDRFAFNTKAYDFLFREYTQYLKSGHREQAVALRKDACDLLLTNCKLCYKISSIFTSGSLTHCQFLFLSVILAKFSIFFNTKSFMGYKTLIEVCTTSIQKLEHQKLRYGSEISETGNRDQIPNDLISRDRLNVGQVYLIKPNYRNLERLKSIGKFHLIGNYSCTHQRTDQLKEAFTEIFTVESQIQKFTSEIETLLTDYRNNLYVETVSVLAEKRSQITEKCLEAAHYCSSTSLPVNLFCWEAANFAINGMYINPYNTDCCDILITLFQREIGLVKEKKQQYLNSDEEIVLMQLVERDIDAILSIEKYLGPL